MTTDVGKIPFNASSREWLLGLVYLFSLSLIGLGLWPFAIVTVIILINRFVKNKPAFIVELFILCTYSGFLDDDLLPFKFSDILMLVSIALLFVYRFDKTVRIINYVILIYAIGVLGLAMLSSEPMSVQIRMMRYYFVIIVYLVPMVVLYREKNALMEVGRNLILYATIICLFYILDGFVLNGHVLVPNTAFNGGTVWNNLYWFPFTTFFPRKYPPGLFILFPTVYFICRYYRLTLLNWIIILIAFLASRTMTVIGGIVIAYLFSLPNRRMLVRLSKVLIVSIVLLYFVDANTGSFMRFSSTVDQFFELREAIETQDIEKLSEFGSGRFAQILPKFDKLIGDGKMMTGFGFIHPTESNNVDLLLVNNFYKDGSWGNILETPAEVEITQAQTILNIGVIGLFFQIVIYVFLALYVRKYYVSWQLFVGTLIGVSIAGFGGFIGLQTPFTMWLSLALGLTLIGGDRKPEITGEERPAVQSSE